MAMERKRQLLLFAKNAKERNKEDVNVRWVKKLSAIAF